MGDSRTSQIRAKAYPLMLTFKGSSTVVVTAILFYEQLEVRGIDSRTSRMLSERSTI